MIIATLDKKFNDNVELFDVFENGKYLVTKNGAIAGVARSVEDALKIIGVEENE